MIILGVLVALVLLLSALAFYNPHVNIPVISPVMCSLS